MLVQTNTERVVSAFSSAGEASRQRCITSRLGLERMALISLRLPDDVAARLSSVASSEGGKSALLRRLITDVLNASPARIAPLPVGRPEKVTVRFRESEMRQLADTAGQRGMTRTGWIVALVRSRLGSPVQHSPGEHASLRAIVRELNRIGGNINQIARAANISVLQG